MLARRIFDSDHAAFRAALRQFLDRRIWPSYDDFLEARGFPRDIWTEAGKHGFLGLSVPEEFGGGGGGDYRFNAVLSEELSHVSVALASCFAIHTNIVAPYLVDLATPEFKDRWLGAYCAGDAIGAIGMTEPSGGSDLAALRTTATRVDGGWLLNGSKTFITNGGSADVVVVAARTTPGSKARGISLFAVEAQMEGFTRGPKLDKVGQLESDTSELFFDDIVVPDSHVLGEIDRGFIHMMERLPQERLSGATTNIGNAEQILAETLEYVRNRKAFGQSIGSFQYNKFTLAELVTKVEVTRAYVDGAVMAHVEGELSPIDAAKAKWWSAQVQNDVLDACLQLHGGYGYMNEYRVARAWRDARVTKIWAGTNEIMKELIGRDLDL